MKLIYNLPLLNTMKREIKRLASSKTLLFASIIGPLASLILVALIFSSGVVRNLPISVIDNDHSKLSTKLIQQINSSPTAKMQKANDINQAHKLMRQGKTSGIVVIPANFERNIIRAESPEIAFFVDNSNVIKGGMVYSGVYKTLATIAGGVKVNVNLKSGMTYNQALESAQPVKIDAHLMFNPYGNYSYFLTLSLLPLMLVIFVFLLTVYALGLELKTGSAKAYMQCSNNSIIVALTGKMLPYTLIFFIHMLIMNLILFRILGTPLQGSLTVLLFAEFFIIVIYQLLAIAILALTSNMRLTLSLGSAYTLMAMTFAGITFPIMAMPIIAKIFSWIFPYTFWIKIFIGQTIKYQPLNTAIPDFLVLLLFVLTCLFSFTTLKRKLTHSKYWGRA